MCVSPDAISANVVSASAPTAGSGPPASPVERALDMDVEPLGWPLEPVALVASTEAVTQRAAVSEICAREMVMEGGHQSCEIQAHDTTVGVTDVHDTTMKVRQGRV